MQETKDIMPLNVSFINAVFSQTPIPRGLLAPYHQQALDINNMLHNQMTRELYNQYNLLEERAVSCIKAKDIALADATRKSGEMEIRLQRALAEAEFWKKESDQKTVLSKDLATRLLRLRRSRNSMAEKKFAEEAQSSTGENGDDDVDTAMTRRCKRRRV